MLSTESEIGCFEKPETRKRPRLFAYYFFVLFFFVSSVVMNFYAIRHIVYLSASTS